MYKLKFKGHAVLIVITLLSNVQLVATFASVERKHYATAGSVAEEVLASIRTVVAFGGEHQEIARYSKTYIA